MARSEMRPAVGSETWSRTALGYMALVLIPAGLMLVALAGKTRGLETPVALEHAQLARRIAAGEGFTSDSIRPLALLFEADVQDHADLYHAPLHPLLVSLAFRVLHPSGRVAGAVGALLWIFSVWLTYVIARQWFGAGIAALAVVFYGVNVYAIVGAVSGLPYPLLAVAVQLAVWLAFPMPRRFIWLQASDLSEPERLAAKLRNGTDPISTDLRERLAPEVRAQLADWQEGEPLSEQLQETLVEDLNRILEEEDIYERQRFSQVPLSRRTSQALRRHTEGAPSPWLARLLLEDAYPQELRGQADLLRQRPDLRQHEESFAEELPDGRLLLIGIACGVATLSHYLLVVLAVVLCLFMGLTQRRGGRAMGLFMAGYLVVLLPWMWRTFQLVRSPFFSLYWYEALARTSVHPGESIWRTIPLAPPPHPALFLLRHPGPVAQKLVESLSQFWADTPAVLNLAAMFLFLMALMVAPGGWRWRGLIGVVAAGLTLTVLGASLLLPDVGLLLAWAPLVAIVAAVYTSQWLERNRPDGAAPAAPDPSDRTRAHLDNPWARAGAYLLVLGLVGFPFVHFMTQFRPGRNTRADQVGVLASRLPPEALVMTDVPSWVCWYGERKALWLCAEEEDFARIERLAPVDATYVTPGVAAISATERVGEWWLWLVSTTGIYRGLTPVDRQPPNAVLRVRAVPSQ